MNRVDRGTDEPSYRIGAVSRLTGVAPDTLRAYLGGGLVPMLAAMAIGIPLYVCATASTPSGAATT